MFFVSSRGVFSAGLVSNLDGTSVIITYETCGNGCKTFQSSLNIRGDEIQLTGGAGSGTYRLGSNPGPVGSTVTVSIIGNNITFETVGPTGFRTSANYTFSGQTCSVSSLGDQYKKRESCHVVSAGGSKALQAKRVRDEHAQGAPDQRCLIVEEPSVIGGCALSKRWHWTNIRSKGGQNCPKSIEFTYMDPDGKPGPDSFFTPYKLQTCGGPPKNVLVRLR